MRFRLRVFVRATVFLVFVSAAYSQDTSSPPIAPPGKMTVATPQANAPSGPVGPTAVDASKQARKALDAASQVEGTASKAADAIEKAQKYQKAINDISGSTAKSTHSPVDDVQTLQSTIEAIQANNLLNSLSAAVSDLDSKSTSITTLTQECDKGKLQQPANTTQQDVTNAQTQCAAARSCPCSNHHSAHSRRCRKWCRQLASHPAHV